MAVFPTTTRSPAILTDDFMNGGRNRAHSLGIKGLVFALQRGDLDTVHAFCASNLRLDGLLHRHGLRSIIEGLDASTCLDDCRRGIQALVTSKKMPLDLRDFKDFSTPLHEACRRVTHPAGRAIALELLDLGADPMARTTAGDTALHVLMSHLEGRSVSGVGAVVDRLVARGADVRALNEERQTPLGSLLDATRFRKICKEWTTLADRLIDHGCDPREKDLRGRPIYCKLFQNAESFDEALPLAHCLIFRGVQPDVSDAMGRNALFYAANTPSVEFLLGFGVNPEMPDMLGRVPLLHHLARLGDRFLLPAERASILSVVTALVREGASTEVIDPAHRKPASALMLKFPDLTECASRMASRFNGPVVTPPKPRVRSRAHGPADPAREAGSQRTFS